MRWGATRLLPVGPNPLYAAISNDDLKVIYARTDAGVLKFSKSVDEGSSFAAETSPGITADDVPLDKPMAYDAVTGRLHLLYSQQVDQSTQPAKLCYRFSDDDAATWSSELVLDDGSTYGNNRFYRVSITANNGIVNIAYSSIDASAFTTAGIFLRRSTNAGSTFSAKTEPWGTGLNGGRPELARAGNSLHVTFVYNTNPSGNGGVGAAYYSRSVDYGATWSAPIQLTSNTTSQRPFIRSENGDVVAAYQSIDSGSFMTLHSRHSGDNGVTWDAEISIASGATGDQEHSYLAQHGKYVYVVWTDRSVTPGALRAKISTDGGASWGSQETPFTSAAELAAPRIVFTKRGVLALCADAPSGATNVLAARKALFLAPNAITDPATPVIENFSSYTNNQSIDGVNNWTVGVGPTNSLKGDGAGHAKRTLGAGSFDRSGSYRNDVTYTGNCEIYVTTGGNADGEINLYFVSTGGNGYSVNDGGGGFANEISLWRIDAGVASVLFQDTTRGMAIGDKIRLQLIATQVIGYVFGVTAGDWQEFACPVDNTWRASLRAELDIAGLNQVPTADDFGGGLLSAPANTAIPTISGAPSIGSVVTAGNGTWNNLPDRYTYQWKRDGVAITDEVLAFYTLQSADVGHAITVTVTASNPVGSASATSAAFTTSQQLRPDADLAVAGWTTAPLWSKVDEAVAGGDVITSDVAV